MNKTPLLNIFKMASSIITQVSRDGTSTNSNSSGYDDRSGMQICLLCVGKNEKKKKKSNRKKKTQELFNQIESGRKKKVDAFELHSN